MSSPDDLNAIESMVANSFGAALIGAVVAAMLYGLTTLQTYFYFMNYPGDKIQLKILVWALWLMDSLHITLVTYCVYFYLVINFMNPSGLANINWSFNITLLLNTILAVVVQIFFTRQIFTLIRRPFRILLTVVIGFAVAGHLCFGIESFVFLFVSKTFIAYDESHVVRFAAVIPFCVFNVLSDVLITTMLCTFLQESRTDLGWNNSLITRIITYAVNRCLLTTLSSITEVILFATLPQSLWWLALDFSIGKLYTNSLLASLNSRRSLRRQIGTGDCTFDLDPNQLSGIHFQRDQDTTETHPGSHEVWSSEEVSKAANGPRPPNTSVVETTPSV
ncbi:hypothetical protein GYMLUDRAFT_43293 [Collybiopsis luxurians FD-317 M1]|uniref:DUF6534 domain-containing protein n=1 Tax=Collybiopsis luxurians FD-317 M1 TaxID=944289 RepID=A0A0D0CF58_9AGAR|nr:hypothetical protein GYMLUDRAFT_43293 [Collybiopsis luxurians FD-317 M1]